MRNSFATKLVKKNLRKGRPDGLKNRTPPADKVEVSVLLISWMVAAATVVLLVASALRNHRNGYRKPERALPPILEAAAWLWSIADEPLETEPSQPALSCAEDLAALSAHVLPKPGVPAVATPELIHR
jgi:hypothetical protein